ncbi:DUF3718 domain-containing protein [Thalassotalea psychrophila]|uniref:DUF3718 domain-containing protein n=1 Tax=Thalassotalea psychrophila TaxID=3065647 RepID=A0ABY9TNT9_9GAMM|nr:DUF3718 domain-containing protein [Colwelliaceae bacterium SQ149]
MRLTHFFTALIALTTTLQVAAQGDTKFNFVAQNNSINTQICIASANNELIKLRQLIIMDKLGTKDITKNLFCNNIDVTHFAALYGANKTTKYLNRYAPKKFKASVDDIKIIELANNDSSPINIIVVSSK